jgi:RNA polymerase sigma-54 factor
MKQGLSLRVSQHLALTPQLQQSIRLLQLSTLELSQEVEQLLDENPFLERADDSAEREAYGLERADTPAASDDAEPDYTTSSSAAETGDEGGAPADLAQGEGWEGDGSVEMSPDDSEWGGDAPARDGAREQDEAEASELARSQESLQDFLKRQVLGLRLSAEDGAALHFLIESLNDDGYLEDPLEELARGLAGDDTEQAEAVLEHFEVALRLLQSLEPTGVGARNLAECLRLQLRARQEAAARGGAHGADPDTLAQALRLVEQPMELLARRDVRKLAQLCGASEAHTREALALIARLEPKPGRRFVNVERNVVVPDVIVGKTGSGTQTRFRVQLNPDVMPRLRVHDIYANALKGHRAGGRDAANHAALQQRLQEARWFIKNIQQRFDTILRVSSAIVERQKNFFMHGELAMRPLVLREIADELGLHESTISRVTTAKYMATPFGTYELKYFFGSGLGTESGGNASSTAVRALIKQFVAAESPTKPLSDSQLSDMLKEQGIECARRTVAKYREALKIAPANLRKAL